MRYYIDTNILIFTLDSDKDNLQNEIKKILFDYSNTIYVSSIVLHELFFLYRIGKLKFNKKNISEDVILSRIQEFGLEIIYFNDKHSLKYLNLKISQNHKDMNDHLIISQAISDKIPLISSDSMFDKYVTQGLQFIFNKR